MLRHPEDFLEKERMDKSIKFKLKVAEHRLKKLRDESNRYCALQEVDEFLYPVEWDHFVTALRSTFDYLAQLVNEVYGLGLLPSREFGSGKTVTVHSVVNGLARKEPEGELLQLLRDTENSEWYKDLNGLRIETVHVKPVTIPKDVTIYPPAAVVTVATAVPKVIITDGRTGEIIETMGEETEPEREQPPPSKTETGKTEVRLYLLLPSGQRVELVPYCETTLANVRDVIEKSYILLRLAGSK